MVFVPDYSIWVAEYAVVPEFPETYAVHGQPGTRVMPFTITVVSGGGHTVLVDTGFSMEGDGRRLAELDGVSAWIHPVEALARVGVDPEQVDTVLITHAHYDHMGTLGDFPNATTYVQAREISRWLWAASLPPALGWLRIGLDIADLSAAVDLAGKGRLRMVDGSVADLLPGISLVPDFDSHTYGHQHVVVDSDSSGRWILPGDVVYSFVNLEGLDHSGEYVPIGFATGSQENCLLVIDQMMKAVDGDTTRIVPGHEHELWQRYPSTTLPDGLHIAEITLGPNEKSRL
jgi:N-acyl homoserine lactone hydrolase